MLAVPESVLSSDTKCSVPIRRIETVQFAQKPWPFHLPIGSAGARLVLVPGIVQDLLRDLCQWAVAGHRANLCAAGELEAMHPVEGFADCDSEITQNVGDDSGNDR